MKKRLFKILFFVFFIFGVAGCGNQNEIIKESNIDTPTIETNIEIVDNIFVYFSDKVGIITWDDAKAFLLKTDYTMEYEEPTKDVSGKIKVFEKSKEDYVLLQFFPKGSDEVLSLLTYQTYNNQYELSISNNQHSKEIKYSLYDVDSVPRNKEVTTLNDLLEVLLTLSYDKNVEPLDVFLDINVEISDSKKAVVSINTNLPDDTKLMITLRGNDYIAQDDISIYGGTGKTTTFSMKGNALPLGIYTVEVSMPLPSIQSEEVRQVIGNKGENLKGELVVFSEFGNSYVVEKNINFTIQ